MEDITLTNETIEEYHQRLNGELRKELQMWKDNEEYQRNRANSIEKLFLKASKEKEKYIKAFSSAFNETKTLRKLLKDREEYIEILEERDLKAKYPYGLKQANSRIKELEQENKEQEEYIKYWQKQYDELQERIDKAMEYIKNNIQEGYSEVYETEIRWDAVSGDELLEILKGEKQ